MGKPVPWTPADRRLKKNRNKPLRPNRKSTSNRSKSVVKRDRVRKKVDN